MFSRPLAFVLLALGCVTAAAGGAYVATRHNATDVPAATAAPVASVAPAASQPATTQPVAETEAAVSSARTEPAPARAVQAETPERAVPAPKRPEPAAAKRTPKAAAAPAPTVRHDPPVKRTVPANGGSAAASPELPPVAQPAPPAPEPARTPEPQPEAPRIPQFEEVILPASSVIGLQLESTLSSERARLEDRVDARVTRDVLAAGRVAIPAGSRVLGSVTVVERGGKLKERARLGIRFHTLVLADGSEVALHTDAVYREGESPAGDSAKKIGVAAVGGAIIGGILGGGKGAAIGGATGAAGGTAAAMQGDRNPATLSRGEVINAKLSSPATITVERRD